MWFQWCKLDVTLKHLKRKKRPKSHMVHCHIHFCTKWGWITAVPLLCCCFNEEDFLIGYVTQFVFWMKEYHVTMLMGFRQNSCILYSDEPHLRVFHHIEMNDMRFNYIITMMACTEKCACILIWMLKLCARVRQFVEYLQKSMEGTNQHR